MVSQTAFQLTLDFLTSKPVVVVPSTDQVSSDAGLLPFRQLDEQLGLTRQFAEALTDRRHAGYVNHSFLEMTRMRVYGILADYADQNDHNVLRSDPIFKLLCDRSIDDDDLASQPTISRFENAMDVRSFFRLGDMLLDQFIASFKEPPRQLTLDIDPFDDPTHGQQQLTFFHGYYEQYQYLPRVITSRRTTWRCRFVCCTARPMQPWAQDELQYVMRRLREAWPDVKVHLRGDSGFGTPAMYAACEQLDIQYTIGIGMNARLKKSSDSLLEQAVSAALQKNNSETLWPIAPEWGDMLLAVPAAERNGPVFPLQAAIDPDSVSRIVCKIGEKAGIIVNRTSKLDRKTGERVEVVKYASAHDLRRSFGFRWADRVDTFKLQELMRHSNIETTRRFYVGRNAQNTAAAFWAAKDRATGSAPEVAGRNTIDNSRPIERIEGNRETTQALDSQGLVMSTPCGSRTRVVGLRIRCPRPLDEGGKLFMAKHLRL